jgi:hypothetical protein
MNRIVVFIASIIGLIGSGAAVAIPMQYSEHVIGSGTLGGVAFSHVSITVSVLGNTTNFHGCNNGAVPNCLIANGPGVVSIGGLGTADFTDPVGAFDNYGGQDAGIGDWTATGGNILRTNSSSFATWLMDTPIGPINGVGLYYPSAYYATSAGRLVISGIDGGKSTFTARTVPEPATAGLFIAGLLALYFLKVVNSRKMPQCSG